ncbi:uncharacterized protein G6M90_00g082550 [Metarhizium brunneum]|uniref:MACPF domain-containing protein n=1 Tax=Metarhizium brunneum TaxID=500148 RepID=A0A7D5V1F9_9HYPO|nr:hypothetical protein G6M90_00g082550 [Metarhizium brunneum]
MGSDNPTPPPGNGAQDQEKYLVYVKKTLVRAGKPDPGTLDQFLKDKLDMRLNMIPARIELGGRLYFSQESHAFSDSTSLEKARSLKVAASLSFSSPYVQASVSATHAADQEHSQTKDISGLNNQMAWKATGGDTRLANNPPAWCSTVGSHLNWRIIHRSEFRSLFDIIRATGLCRELMQAIDKLAPHMESPEVE